MASNKLYEPAARCGHVSFSVQGQMYLWGGVPQDLVSGLKDDRIKLANCIERFDPYLEEWRQLNTTGTPHPGLEYAVCASIGGRERMYMYGGVKNGSEGVRALSCLNMKTLTWSQLELCGPAGTAGGPMGKTGCGMVHFHHDKLAVIGGYGFPTGPIQPGSTFIRNSRFIDEAERGWTNEIHVFDLNQGVWFSPVFNGIRPPPSSTFTLTSIDNHRALLFGGGQLVGCGITSDLYLIDFDTMESTKVEPIEGEPWPVERCRHAACCLGYAGDHIHLLVTGGINRNGKALKDVWLFDLSLKKWKEVILCDGALPRWRHSTKAITLCPGLIEVIVFGGRPDDYDPGRPSKDNTRIAETTIITFSQVGSEWELVGVTSNSQLGTSERVREKMLKISEIARATIDSRANGQPEETSQALEERVEDAEAAMREERARVRDAQNRAELAERAVIEERERTQEEERRMHDSQEQAQTLEVALAEERRRAQEYETRVVIQSREERHRADMANQRIREIRQELAASQERERTAEVRVQQAQQQAQQRVEEIERATEEQLLQAEERVQVAERRSHDLQQRAHDTEQRAHVSEQRSHNAEQRTTAVERQLHEVEQRARESERRARQAEALVQQSQRESYWLVQRREIELTEEERGRGGWAVVKVANFRRTRVAAKCFYQQILVSRYNRQLFNREMNMAARLRHPNLVQFIGASLEGEPIILTELMTISLRAELEKGPIQHVHTSSISLDVARALNYLHLMQPHPIIHRDISSANVLLDPLPGNGWKAKVSDYGSVNLLWELRTVGPGNPAYAAPEARIPAEQSPKMDIFSFGVLLIEMLTNEFPAEDAHQQLLDSIDHPGYLDLIRRCLGEQKEDRPPASEIIAEISEM